MDVGIMRWFVSTFSIELNETNIQYIVVVLILAVFMYAISYPVIKDKLEARKKERERKNAEIEDK